ncbi:MAG TPA: DUF2877 domain-containing protein [Candidatus Methylomirabilis sp.]|jgi:hypothetical protein
MTLHFTAVIASRNALDLLDAAAGRGGEIHSTYRNTINVRFPGDQLLTLHSGRKLLAPFGIALGRRFHSPAFERIAPGTPVETAESLLRIPEAGLELTTAGAPAWEPQALPVALPPPAARHHAEILEGIVRRHAHPDGLAGLVDPGDTTPLLRRARSSAAALMEGLARGEPSLLMAGAEPLLGLGPGLTPAGDDFLAGFLGMAVLASPAAMTLLRDTGTALLSLASKQTTLLSYAFLREAIQGVLAPPVDALAAAILHGAEPKALAHAALGAAGLGHTSGLDMLAGMIFALRCLGGAAA